MVLRIDHLFLVLTIYIKQDLKHKKKPISMITVYSEKDLKTKWHVPRQFNTSFIKNDV